MRKKTAYTTKRLGRPPITIAEARHFREINGTDLQSTQVNLMIPKETYKKFKIMCLNDEIPTWLGLTVAMEHMIAHRK